MDKRLPTIWMNVTTSENWRRPAVGIVRVEREMSDGLAHLYGERFRKCIWDGNRFVELKEKTKEPEKKRQPEGIISDSTKKNVEKSRPHLFPVLGRKQALRYMAQGFFSIVPASFRTILNPLLIGLRSLTLTVLSSEIYRGTRVLMSRWGQIRQGLAVGGAHCNQLSEELRFSTSQSDIFVCGDIFISVGLDWDYEYFKSFYQLREDIGVKVVTCCYDLIPVLYPQYCVSDVAPKFSSYFLEIADASSLILCISKQSQSDLHRMLELTGGASVPTCVFPLGDNVPAASGGVLSSDVKNLLSTRFILFVSTIERRKNHEVLYRAYHLLSKEGKGAELPTLVFVGMPGWGVDELLKDIELDPITIGLIVRLNHVSDSELQGLYKAAMFCVFPSLYEGWGLPVGEALAMGKVIICSDRGSLPEVGGDLVRYVDPWNPRAWADEIYRMSTDSVWLNHWTDLVKTRYVTKSWLGAATVVKSQIDRML